MYAGNLKDKVYLGASETSLKLCFQVFGIIKNILTLKSTKGTPNFQR